MRAHEFPFNLLLFLSLSFFLGIVIAEQWLIMAYYHGEHLIDQAIFISVAFISFALGHKWIGQSSYSASLLLIFLLLFGLTGDWIGYHLHRHTDWASLIVYGIVGVCSSTVSMFSKATNRPKVYILFAVGLITGFLLTSNLEFPEPSYFIFPVLAILVIQFVLLAKFQATSVALTGMLITAGFLYFDPIPLRYFERQKNYYDPVIYSGETAFQTIDITRWKGQNWFYYNNVNQFSSIDHWLYFEPMVHPLMQLAPSREKVLVLGSENGIIANELLKYPEVTSIDYLPVDSTLFRIASENHHFTALNEGALKNQKIQLHHEPAFDFLHHNPSHFDLIFIDVPDPLDIELNQYYTKEFYELCYDALSNRGMLITQAGSPYYASKAFRCIEKTLMASGFSTLPMHNQVLTLGEWGWIIGAKNKTREELKSRIKEIEFISPETKWLNKEAMGMMLSFGKLFTEQDTSINTLKNPIVHRYYIEGTWKF